MKHIICGKILSFTNIIAIAKSNRMSLKKPKHNSFDQINLYIITSKGKFYN